MAGIISAVAAVLALYPMMFGDKRSAAEPIAQESASPVAKPSLAPAPAPSTQFIQEAGSRGTQIGTVEGNVIVNQTVKEQEIPPIRDKRYTVARAELIEHGWIPQTNHWAHADTVEVQSGSGPYLWGQGFHELDYCSGTGYALCRLEFNDPKGNLLVVITAGEDEHATVFRVYLNPKNEKGAYVETLGAKPITLEDMQRYADEARKAAEQKK
ncbi:MAG: hypothetical protein HC869_25060 [Rhodospirillales bacterium]|nr:hypothetical protein [Rhodospirillales bacterium]